MKTSTLQPKVVVVAIAGIVLGIVATSLFSPHPAGGAEGRGRSGSAVSSPSSGTLAERIPGFYLMRAQITELRFAIVSAAPMIQMATDRLGVMYTGYEIDAKAGRVTLRFWTMGSAWNERSLIEQVEFVLEVEFPNVPADVWAFHVMNLATREIFDFSRQDGGVWRTGKFKGTAE